MNDVKFVKYQETPNEKHFGIMTVMVNNLIYLRYKISPGKTGGQYANPASYKIVEDGADKYLPCFGFESNMLNEEVQGCIRSNLNRIFNLPSVSLASSGNTYQTNNTRFAQGSVPNAVQEEIPF